MLYRGMTIDSINKSKLLRRGGIPIQSRVMAWTPNYGWARDMYVNDYRNFVILKHKPNVDDVIVSLTESTLRFLQVDRAMVCNKGETILSLPILKITPDMVAMTNISK